MKHVLALSLIALLAACAATPVYGPAMSRDGMGYRETQIEADRYRLSYRDADAGRATDGALRRAAELTVQNGYDYFTVVARDSGSTRGSGRGPTIGIGGSTGGGWGGTRVGVGVSVPVTGVASAPTDVRLEIILGRGVEPAGTDSYNAREVLSNLVPRRS